ncbi:MAG: BLUF domain-containing protein [Casimicrobiaceae bacterium]
MYRRLAYVSRLQENLPVTQIPRIVAQCRARNLRDDITGVLAFTGHDFAQLIEGPRDAVGRLWTRIAADRRHHDVVVLFDEPSEARWCGDWRIGFPVDPSIARSIAVLRDGRGHFDGAAKAEFLRLLTDCEPE